MVDNAACATMVVTVKVGAVAANAFAATGNGRGNEGAICSGVVASCATVGGMGLADTDKGRGGGRVTTGAIYCRW